MNIENTSWVLKHAPRKIEDILLSEKNKEYFSSLKDIPNNMLFVGSPGSGKTTLAKVLAKKFAPESYMFLNASDESGIDVVRTKIKDFIETMSLDGNQKVVILDEVDGFSNSAQDALRFIMEEYLNDVKFILTGNHRNKIREAIHSRCISFDFAVGIKQIFKRSLEILESEHIELNVDDRRNVAGLVKQFFPDIRKTINEIQKCCKSGKFIFEVNDTTNISQDIFNKIQTKEDIWSIREFTITNESAFFNDYHLLMKNLFRLYVDAKDTAKVMFIVDALYRHAIVTDPEINFTGLLVNLTK